MGLVKKIEILFYKIYFIIIQQMTFRTFLRIDNQIVEKMGNGCIIGPIRLYERQHKVKLTMDSVPFVFTGSRLSDSILMQRLIAGEVRFDDLQPTIVYPNHSFR